MFKLLLLDDNEYALKTYGRYLSAYFDLTSTRSPFEAIQFLAANPDRYFAAIFDYQIPGMTGREVIHHLRAKNVNTPVLLCTGCPLDEASDCLFHGVLEKPATREDLLVALGEIKTPRAKAPAMASSDPGLSDLDKFVLRKVHKDARTLSEEEAEAAITDRSKLLIWRAWRRLRSR